MRRLVVLVLLAACGGKAPPPASRPTTPSPRVASDADLDAFRQAICACDEDDACVEQDRDDGVAPPLEDCTDYGHLVDRYQSCDHVPRSARDVTAKAYEAMKAGWADVASMSDEDIRDAEDACFQDSQALRETASAMGCTL
jgi:hypothetical protein